MLQAPMAAIFMVDEDRLWPKAAYGGKAPVLPRSLGMAPHATAMADAFVVLDAQRQDGLRAHPLVAGPPFMRFYAATPIRSPDGHVVGAISVADTRPRADMSADGLACLEALARLAEAELERRLMSRCLQETADRFRDLAEVSSDWVWETDREHRLVDLVSDNPVMVGIAPAGIGRRRWEFRDSKPLRGSWADHVADLEARREFRGFEYEVTTDEGDHRVFRLNGRPRFDPCGRFLGYRGTGADVTQRRAEELARAVNQRLFETSLDLIVATDAQGNFIVASPSCAGILGYAPAELIGHSAARVIHPDDIEVARQAMRAARRGGTMRFDSRWVASDGRVVPISWKGLWSETDRHFFFIGRDITEQLAAEERQRQSQRLEAIGQLTGGIAHDFNNILSIMMMKMENGLEELPADSPCRPTLASALAAGARGADLVSRLMTFARRRPLEPTETATGALLEELSGLIRTAISRRIPLSLDVAGDLRPCRIDRTGLETAILNLAVNARDAMPDGGELHIGARNRTITSVEADARPDLRAGRWIEISVRDTGTGMPPDVQARVFEPFFTTKGEGKGTGLGLAMVHGFVHQSGGFLTLRSAVGRGTTFSLYLPAVVEPGSELGDTVLDTAA
jgi:PAS domain S-box-containing protein